MHIMASICSHVLLMTEDSPEVVASAAAHGPLFMSQVRRTCFLVRLGVLVDFVSGAVLCCALALSPLSLQVHKLHYNNKRT